LTEKDLTIFPYNTIPLNEISWKDYETLMNSDIWTAVTLISRDISNLSLSLATPFFNTLISNLAISREIKVTAVHIS
jgi:hypothetical protein